MTHEGFPVAEQEQVVAPASIYHEDGSLNEAVLSDRFGLGIEEANQVVIFGKYKGTVAQMLGDETCPVSGMLEESYKQKDEHGVEGGIKAVAEKLETLKILDSRFSVTITPATRERENLKKKNRMMNILSRQ